LDAPLLFLNLRGALDGNANDEPERDRVKAMKLLRMLVCLLIGHAPIVGRRGDDSVLACERCQRFFNVFVKGVYAVK
jgi:hypothetical protein